VRARLWLTLGALGATSLMAGCSAKPASAPEHTQGAAEECPLVMEKVGRFEETVQLSAQEEKQRGSLASALRLMRRFDRGVNELNAALDAAPIHDRALRAHVDAYRAATRELGEGAESGAALVEGVASKMSEPLAAATNASVELDRACASTNPDCASLLAVLKKTNGSSALDSTPADLVKAVAAIREVHPRRAKVALAQEHLAVAMDGLAETLGQLEQTGEEPRKVLDAAGDRTKKAGDELRTLCGKATAHHGTAEWVIGTKQDVRDLTVIVSFQPPGGLRSSFERAAESAPEGEGGFYKGAAAGGFGSGFVLVRRTEQGKAVFVITNRHVVELADHAVVTRTDGKAFRARIVYSDPHYDLAVLALEGDDAGFDHGFDLETEGVHDEQSVVATGFPGLDHHPSYQVTKGYVSNDRFELDAGGLKLPYIQHTAAIDRGSSGGPLMNEAGKVLGVNTLKAFNREGVAFAAPAAAVVGAVRYASTLDARLGSAAFRRQTLRDDCLDLVAELQQKSPRPWRLAQLVSTRMMAEEGVESFNVMAERDEDLRKYWKEDPVDAIRFAVAMRLKETIEKGGGVAATEMCGAPNRSDSEQILTTDRVRIPIQIGTETQDLSMRWEQGRWKIAHMDFPPPPPAAKGKSKPKPLAKTKANDK
jgi:S1-C subfamily serine protease